MATGLMLLLILFLALLPAVLSLWQLYCLDRRMQQGRRSGENHRQGLDHRYRPEHRPDRYPERRRQLERPHRLSGIRHQNASVPEFRYIEGVGYVIGDLSCEFNAKSPYIRCAVNPEGPCKGCRSYQAKQWESTAQTSSLSQRSTRSPMASSE